MVISWGKYDHVMCLLNIVRASYASHHASTSILGTALLATLLAPQIIDLRPLPICQVSNSFSIAYTNYLTLLLSPLLIFVLVLWWKKVLKIRPPLFPF